MLVDLFDVVCSFSFFNGAALKIVWQYKISLSGRKEMHILFYIYLFDLRLS